MLDDKFASLYRGGKIHGGVFLGRGQEALSVSIGLSLRKGDFFAPLIRDAAGRLAFGETILDAVRTYLGSPLGPMRGAGRQRASGQSEEGHTADDQPFGRDDFGGERRFAGAPVQGNRAIVWERRAWAKGHFDRGVSRGFEPGGGGEAAAGAGGGEQPICLFDAERAAVRLRSRWRTRRPDTAWKATRWRATTWRRACRWWAER